jgi:hypothetical protein
MPTHIQLQTVFARRTDIEHVSKIPSWNSKRKGSKTEERNFISSQILLKQNSTLRWYLPSRMVTDITSQFGEQKCRSPLRTNLKDEHIVRNSEELVAITYQLGTKDLFWLIVGRFLYISSLHIGHTQKSIINKDGEW